MKRSHVTLVATILGPVALLITSTSRADTDGSFTYQLIGGDTAVEITNYLKTATGKVVIPDRIAGKPVTSIGDKAFSGCKGLTSVEVPDSVTSIGEDAFYMCSGLTSVTIPESVTNIGNAAFYGCSGLSSVVFLGDAPKVGTNCFDGSGPDFSVLYPGAAAGFTSPKWRGYPAQMTDNILYETPLQVGYTAPRNENAVVAGNRVINAGMSIDRFKQVEEIDNFVLAPQTTRPDRPAEVILRPDRHTPGRAHLAILNWRKAPAVAIDLGAVVKTGHAFEVLNALDYFGKPVASGVFDGSPVSIPVPVEERTGHGEFCAFVVQSRASTPPAAGEPPTAATRARRQPLGRPLRPRSVQK